MSCSTYMAKRMIDGQICHGNVRKFARGRWVSTAADEPNIHYAVYGLIGATFPQR
jgi:hypothetical protein